MDADLNCNVELPSDSINENYNTRYPLIYALDIIGQKWRLPIMLNYSYLLSYSIFLYGVL
jgi:hypothetical protein